MDRISTFVRWVALLSSFALLLGSYDGYIFWVDQKLKAVAILLSGTDSKGGCIVETIKAESSSLPCQRQQALMVESYLDNTFCRDRRVFEN